MHVEMESRSSRGFKIIETPSLNHSGDADAISKEIEKHYIQLIHQFPNSTEKRVIALCLVSYFPFLCTLSLSSCFKISFMLSFILSYLLPVPLTILLFSLSRFQFGNPNGKDYFKYYNGALRNLELRDTFFPGWTVRVYLSKEIPTEHVAAMTQLGAEIVEVSKEDQMFSRFFVGFDPTVDRYIIRDADSRLNSRER